MKPINLPGLSHLYLISEDGRVLSLKKMIFVKPSVNSVGHSMVHLSSDNPQTLPSHWHMVSRLVIFTYGPPPPTPKHEVDHIDEDKLNCHISNLRWVVHTLRSPAEDHRRRETCGRKPGFNHNPQTLEKMSLAKKSRSSSPVMARP